MTDDGSAGRPFWPQPQVGDRFEPPADDESAARGHDGLAHNRNRQKGIQMSDRNIRLAGLYSVLAAAASLLLAPLLALSYFATEDGASELEIGTVSAWAEPARDLAGALLTFASPDQVYTWYGRVFVFLMPALALVAWLARSRRPDRPKLGERWGWRIALTGYALGTVGTAVAFWTPFLDAAFLFLMMPGMLLMFVGSTTLGIGLLRADYRPRATPWLLALSIPLMIVASGVLGHNSLGLVPLLTAWAATGWRLGRADAHGVGEPAIATTG